MAIETQCRFLHGPNNMIETVTAIQGVRVANNHDSSHMVSVSAYQIGFNIDAINGF
jgi:hypothetical protein